MTSVPESFQPIADFPSNARRRIRAVMTDIDDTLTENGRLSAIAYRALERLRDAGLIVIPVTGRPAGWCDMIARQWPVHGVVGENGAFYFRYVEARRCMIRHYMKTQEQRSADRLKLETIRDEVLANVKGTAVANDQAYREADLAIDFAEDVAALDPLEIKRIVNIFEAHGATAKISSIHVNGWFGGYDKLSTSLTMLAEEFGVDARADRFAVVFVGDSPNDAPMFGFFPNSVGVANVMHFADILPAAPSYVTRASGGRGFSELVDQLLQA